MGMFSLLVRAQVRRDGAGCTAALRSARRWTSCEQDADNPVDAVDVRWITRPEIGSERFSRCEAEPDEGRLCTVDGSAERASRRPPGGFAAGSRAGSRSVPEGSGRWFEVCRERFRSAEPASHPASEPDQTTGPTRNDAVNGAASPSGPRRTNAAHSRSGTWIVRRPQPDRPSPDGDPTRRPASRPLPLGCLSATSRPRPDRVSIAGSEAGCEAGPGVRTWSAFGSGDAGDVSGGRAGGCSVCRVPGVAHTAGARQLVECRSAGRRMADAAVPDAEHAVLGAEHAVPDAEHAVTAQRVGGGVGRSGTRNTPGNPQHRHW
ncbi:hypothetical protein LY15_002391 [Prauserella flava]|nr:hypothetical protein [Prauserella flava]MCR3733874.1 hypothetical protein [Prauserella salsuginis]